MALLASSAGAPASQPATDEPAMVFRREGEYWTISFGGKVVRMRDAKGLGYLSRLLRHPHREFHVLDLLVGDRSCPRRRWMRGSPTSAARPRTARSSRPATTTPTWRTQVREETTHRRQGAWPAAESTQDTAATSHACRNREIIRMLSVRQWARSRDYGGQELLENETAASLEPIGGDASTVRVLFCDLHGVARGKDVPVREFDRVAEHGICFCSAVMGTDLRNTPVVGRDEGYPDMCAVPDMSTLLPVPWEPGVSAVIADLMRVGGKQPEPMDPRGTLRCAVSELEALGFSPIVGPELEFYLCRSDGGDPHRFSRHLDRMSMIYTVGPQADPDGLVRRLTEMLSDFGLGAFALNHEFGNGQYEINLREAPALTAADRGFLLKSAVKDVAGQNGRIATFMGKPFNDQSGSGFHVHVSLNREGTNAFADPDDPDGISGTMRGFLAGVLQHAPALMALLNPTVNAYRRIVPGSLAPTHANWGWDNRTAMVRVPADRGDATRLEVRMGDGSANPYLAIAGVLFAGLHGLRESLRLQPPLAGELTSAADEARGAPLARSLEASLAALEQDAVLRALIAPKLLDTFVAVKRFELERHRAWVSDWEVEEYLRHL